jgi:DNA-binding LytR/AlgR family response regulator
MAVDFNTCFARYQPIRRRAEVAFWVAILSVQTGFNILVSLIELQHANRPVAAWEPVMWELTSVLVIGMLIPAVAAFERRFALRWDTLPRSLLWHLGASVVFCIVHVLVAVALRKVGYAAMGSHYQFFGDWKMQLAYEYLKDVRSYAMILLAILSYRFLMLRLQGEARVLDAPESAPATATESRADAPPGPPPTPPQRPERFLVRKLRREFLIAASDIEWLQAQGNYVGLRVRGHDYLLRSTLADFLEQLDPARFTRVHRSYAVNLDQIAEIEPLEAGDARLRMRDGSQVPCSRRYRDALAAPH